jgi:uncharacterized protein (TIRG00374 family)
VRIVTRSIRLSVVALVVSLAIPLMLGGTPQGLAQLGSVQPELLVMALSMVAIGWMFNAARLYLLTGNVDVHIPPWQALGVVISTEFAGAATPGGIGGPLTYLYLLHRRGLSSARAASLYAVDHIMDLAFFCSALPLALIIFAMDGRLSHPLWFAMATIGPLAGGVIIVIAFMRYYRWLIRGIGKAARLLRISLKLRRRLVRWAIRFRKTVGLLSAMPRPRLTLLYVCCAGHWLLRYSVLPLLLFGLGQTVPWSYLFVIQGLLLFAGQLSLLPGGAGGVELGFAALLAAWLEPQTLGVALLLWRFVTFYWYLSFGGAVFALTVGRGSKALLESSL